MDTQIEPVEDASKADGNGADTVSRFDEARMSFTEHLGELRTRIVRSGIAIMVGFIVCYIFSNQLIEAISWPLAILQDEGMIVEEKEAASDGDGGNSDAQETSTEDGEDATPEAGATEDAQAPKKQMRPVEWTILNPLEPVLVKLRLSAYGGVLLVLPYILFQICAFIFPGLKEKEKRAIKFLLYGCTILGVTGALVAYRLVFPLVLPYLVNWAPSFVKIQLRLNETISLILKGLFGFAVAFQFPMIVLILVYMDLLTPQTLKKYRRFAFVGMFVVGMMLTPPDPFSMAMLALPLIILYEMSIWASYLVVRKRAKEKLDASS